LNFDEPVQKAPFELVLDKRSNTDFFDLQELPDAALTQDQRAKVAELSLNDKINRKIMWMWGLQDFKKITRGLRRDTDQELLLVGELGVKQGRIQMRNPMMVIGSDRLELYEFFSRRKEMWTL
jgi:hypothetical protein